MPWVCRRLLLLLSSSSSLWALSLVRIHDVFTIFKDDEGNTHARRQTDRQTDRQTENSPRANKLFCLLRAMDDAQQNSTAKALMLILSSNKFFHFINLMRTKRRAEERKFCKFFFALNKIPTNKQLKRTNPFRCSKSSDPIT